MRYLYPGNIISSSNIIIASHHRMKANWTARLETRRRRIREIVNVANKAHTMMTMATPTTTTTLAECLLRIMHYLVPIPTYQPIYLPTHLYQQYAHFSLSLSLSLPLSLATYIPTHTACCTKPSSQTRGQPFDPTRKAIPRFPRDRRPKLIKFAQGGCVAVRTLSMCVSCIHVYTYR